MALHTVVFHWDDAFGFCYECGRPAHFESDENSDRPFSLRCGVCAANDAAGGAKVWRIDEAPEIMESRVFLVHLNVEVPRSDFRPEKEIVEAIEGALSVGWDDDSVRGLNVCVALTERV
jgi:hypothetical protein